MTGAINPLAGVLTATIRELHDVHVLHAAERDYMAWLQLEVCKARDWSIIDVTKAWYQELDRRAAAQARVHGECAA
jgi:hypothetical protein